MICYAIYENPVDCPGKFVVRRWSASIHGAVADAQPHAVTNTLEEARQTLPSGLVMSEAWPGDDPVIAEVWL